jgi:hypothetical protein
MAEPGYTKPREREPGCVGRQIAMPSGVTGRIVIRIRVAADGIVKRVDRLSDVNVPLAYKKMVDDLVESGVRSCAFEPGRDPEGRPQEIWLILPLRFEG